MYVRTLTYMLQLLGALLQLPLLATVVRRRELCTRGLVQIQGQRGMRGTDILARAIGTQKKLIKYIITRQVLINSRGVRFVHRKQNPNPGYCRWEHGSCYISGHGGEALLVKISRGKCRRVYRCVRWPGRRKKETLGRVRTLAVRTIDRCRSSSLYIRFPGELCSFP